MEMELPQGALLQTGLPNIEFNEIFLIQTHSLKKNWIFFKQHK